MRFMGSTVAAALAVALCALCGCLSKEENRDYAVDKARKYVMSEIPNLSEENRAFVRLAYPRFLQTTLLRKREMNQLCLVWDTPYLDGDSIVVAGVCNSSYADWEPIRVIIKKYNEPEKPQD